MYLGLGWKLCPRFADATEAAEGGRDDRDELPKKHRRSQDASFRLPCRSRRARGRLARRTGHGRAGPRHWQSGTGWGQPRAHELLRRVRAQRGRLRLHRVPLVFGSAPTQRQRRHRVEGTRGRARHRRQFTIQQSAHRQLPLPQPARVRRPRAALRWLGPILDSIFRFRSSDSRRVSAGHPLHQVLSSRTTAPAWAISSSGPFCSSSRSCPTDGPSSRPASSST